MGKLTILKMFRRMTTQTTSRQPRSQICKALTRQALWYRSEGQLGQDFKSVVKGSNDGILHSGLLFLNVVHYLVVWKNVTFWKLDLIFNQIKWLRLALSNGPYWVGAFLPLHLRVEMDLVSKMLCSFRIQGDDKMQKLSSNSKRKGL
jgi:hypothetical protein